MSETVAFWLMVYFNTALVLIGLLLTTDWVERLCFEIDLLFKITMCCLMWAATCGENTYTITVTRNNKEKIIEIGE